MIGLDPVMCKEQSRPHAACIPVMWGLVGLATQLSEEFEVESLAVVAPPGCRLQKGVLGRGPHLGWGERGEDHILQVKRELLTECTCMQGEL